MSCEIGACFLKDGQTAGSPNCTSPSLTEGTCNESLWCVYIDSQCQFSPYYDLGALSPGVDGRCPKNEMVDYVKMGSPNQIRQSLRLAVSVFAILMVGAAIYPWVVVAGFDAKLPFLQKPVVYIVAAAVIAVTTGILLAFASKTVHEWFGVIPSLKQHYQELSKTSHAEGGPSFKDFMNELLLGQNAMLGVMWSLWFLAALFLVLTAVLRKKGLMIASSCMTLLLSAFATLFAFMLVNFPEGDLLCRVAKDLLQVVTTGNYSITKGEQEKALQDQHALLGWQPQFGHIVLISLLALLPTAGAVGGSIVAGRVAGTYFK